MGLGEQRLHRRLVRNVRDAVDHGGLLGQLCDVLLQRGVNIDQRQGVMLRREPPGTGKANAGGGAADDSNFLLHAYA